MNDNSENLFFCVAKDPYNHIMHIMCNRWKPYLIRAMDFEDEEGMRFSTFKKRLPISERVLAMNLKALQSDGIIIKEVFAEVPVRVEYKLTELGKTLCPILDSMYKWGWEDMKRKNIEVDPLGEMWHGYREKDEELMREPFK
ncbi:helix-turn-helix domain-containing protein [Fusibacter sp. 3D3]|uniref:winged helix-turn-helix transcriptional regulator n=1 Tax=Fusibacter sp. 3D3 TaxID=1048380 RepID=UPI000852F556|nr:helix-turn-helix domain-containing protein [Fusibacter sp. 3D3]GAU75603.1 transcriptional regulator [Fusibacter sp. 3D3]